MPTGKHRKAAPPRRSLPRPDLSRLIPGRPTLRRPTLRRETLDRLVPGRLVPSLPRSRRLTWVAAPLATVAVVGGGVALTGAGDSAGGGHHVDLAGLAHRDLSAASAVGSISGSALTGATRSASISRSLDRIASTTVTDRMWSTAKLNLYTSPSENAKVDGVLPTIKRIGLTGQTRGAFSQVVVDGESRWVHSDFLSDSKPQPPEPTTTSSSGSAGSSTSTVGGLVFSPCSATASVESGLVPDAIRAWEAVCNQFPQVSTYGGVAARPEHDTGHAVDAMVYGDSGLGYQIAEFLQAHAAELNLYDIIWHQHIWTPVRASEGWRLMPDRGSSTANHMDHVHFAVN